MGRLASKAIELSARCSAQRRPAPLSALRRADQTRLLCVRVLDLTGTSSTSSSSKMHETHFQQQETQSPCVLNLSSQKPSHTTGGSGQHGAGRTADGAMLGRTRFRHFGRLGSQTPLWPSSVMKTTVLKVSLQARTNEMPCKLLREQNVQLTRRLSAVYHQ